MGVGNFLPTNTADPIAHVPIHDASNKRHPGQIIHAIAKKKTVISCLSGGRDKTVDLFWQMLAVGIENDHVYELSIQPVSQACLDRFAFAAVLAMDNNFSAGFARASCSVIARSIIDHDDMIELLAGSTNNVTDMLLFAVRRNNRGCF